MGADLYITKIHKDYFAFDCTLASVKKGYFRDCYNEGGLFAFLRNNTDLKGLSWWALREVKDWFNSKGNMTIEGAKNFLSIIKQARDQIYYKNEYIVEHLNFPNMDKAITILSQEDVIEYKEWLECLIAFLELAIKKNSTIRWSV